MSTEPVPIDPDLTAIEASLGALAPARSRLDRDRVMYRAGKAATRPRPSAWLAIAASLGLLAFGEAILLARRPAGRVIEKIVVVKERVPSAPLAAQAREREPVPPAPSRPPIELAPTLGTTDYNRLAGQVLRYGLDGLPASPTGSWGDPEPRSVSSGELLRKELGNALDPGDPS